MRLYEYEASELFRREDIPFPSSAVATSAGEAREKATEIGLPVVIKAQVLVGGRGLAGGVQTAASLEQVAEVADRILRTPIKGWPVQKIMVARQVAVAREFYLGVTIDGYEGRPVVILSGAGGVSVEEMARTYPEMVTSRHVSISTGLTLPEAQEMAERVGLSGKERDSVANLLHILYRVFRKYDALTAEINPLVRSVDGTYLALDAKVEIDDSALYRHSDLNLNLEERIPNPLERQGQQIGVTYVDLDGDIGIIASGAGLGMATMDIVGRKLRPANFLETGGAITAELLYRAMALVMQKKPRAVFINLYGGINPIHEGARGIVRYIREYNVTIPVVAKALGNRQEETWEILRGGGVRVVTDVATEKGVAELAHLLEGKG
jgi:succinyl-CoA synthetase beta subunit